MAILAIGAVSASEDISDDVAAIEPTDEVISDQIDDNLEETDPQEEILEEDGETKSLNDFKQNLEGVTSESNVLEINLTNDYKYNPDTDENITRVVLAGEEYRFKTIILDGQGHSVDGGGKDLIMRLGYMMSNVTVKNIIFKNFNRTEEISSGYRDFINIDARNGRFENLALENISSTTSGYLIYLQGGYDDDSYAIENCTFKDNEVRYFLEIARNDVQVNDCNFTNNDATYFISDDQRYPDNYKQNIQLNNCIFEGNNASYFISFKAINSQINDCNFSNNTAWGYGYLTNQFGNNSKMYNCIFEDNFIGQDHSRSPVAWFGDLDDDQPTGENISVSKVTFKNNVAIPIRWDALSGNVTDCVFIGNNGTIDNRGNVYRDNGIYDFEVIVYNDTIIGVPDMYHLDNILAEIENYGSKTGNIVILLDGIEAYNKEMGSNSLSIKLDELSNVKAGEVPIVVKFINGEEELELYDGTAFIDYYFGIDSYSNYFRLSIHDVLTVNITLPTDASGMLVINDGFKNSTVPYANGKANYTIDASVYKELGEYTFTLSLVNDPSYTNRSVDYHLAIMLYIAFPDYVAEGEVSYISYDFPDDFVGGIVVFNTTGPSGTGDMIIFESLKGSGFIPFPALTEGDYRFYYEIPGVSEGSSFPVYCFKNNESFDANVESNNILIGEDAVLNVVSERDNCTLYVFVDKESLQNNKFRMFNLSSTPFSYNISDLGLGEHRIKILIIDNDLQPIPGVSPLVYSNSFEVTVTEPPVSTRKATKIIYENMVTTAVSPLNPRTGQYFTWKLVDGDGNPLKNTPMQIGFNGVIYDERNGIVTDENGVARLQINLGYVGDYTFAICFLGNDSYNASFAVAKITVKAQTPQLVVPNKSYKAAAKTKALTATFKTVKGTPIENKKVSFTVNGKTYTAKTNAKGVVTVNVSLNKKGTYSFTAKFAGDSTYAAVTKNAKLVIN